MGSRGIVWATIGAELITVCFELRYMVILSIILIVTDFWWGYRENTNRFEKAREKNNVYLMEKYRWHKSRAVRRSANKACDYLTYLLIGAFLGLGITEPMDICGHVFSAAIALGLGCLCEIASIVGHILYLKLGIEIKVSDAWKWATRFFINLIKIKNHDMGEAMEGTITEYDKEQHIEE